MATANKTAFCLRLTQSQIKNRSSCADRSTMKPILSIIFSFLLFLIAPTLVHAEEVCPNEQEWTAIKYRAFHMKLFQVAGRCFPHRYVCDEDGDDNPANDQNCRRTHASPEGPRVDQASMKLSGDCAFRPFHVDQMRIVSEYFDRRHPNSGRADIYSNYGSCRRDPGPTGRYNQRYETHETLILQKTETQIRNAMSTPAVWQSYCAEAIRTVDQILQMDSSDDLPELFDDHPFALQHDLTACDNGNGAISATPISLDNTAAEHADTNTDRDAPIITNPERQNQILSQPQHTDSTADTDSDENDVILLNTGAEDRTRSDTVVTGPISILPVQTPAVRAAALGISVQALERLYIEPDSQGRCRPNYTLVSASNGTIKCAPLSR